MAEEREALGNASKVDILTSDLGVIFADLSFISRIISTTIAVRIITMISILRFGVIIGSVV
jgi:hypothetical protein